MNKLVQTSSFALHSLQWSKHLIIGPLTVDLSLQKRNDNNIPARPAIGNRLALLRDERGVSRQELALALNVRLATLEAVESGTYTPSLDLAFRISSFFSLPVDAIFSYHRNTNNYTL